MTRYIILALFLFISGCTESPLVTRVNEEAKTFPAGLREGWRLAKARCSRCHTVDRALREEVTAGGWGSIVEMMITKNGAYVRPEEKSLIVSFFEFYSENRSD